MLRRQQLMYQELLLCFLMRAHQERNTAQYAAIRNIIQKHLGLQVTPGR